MKIKEGNMKILKVLNVKEFVLSHILLVGGLVLITIGLLQETMALTVIGIWVIALGLCLAFGFIFAKLVAK